MKKIQEISVEENNELTINSLPSSIKVLSACREQIGHLNFKELPNLTLLESNTSNRLDFPGLP